MDPLEFEPLLKRIRWGGRRLGTVLGKPIGDADDYAESWEIADCGDDQSTVAEGPFAGWTLARLVAEQKTALFGPPVSGATVSNSPSGPAHFPLLIKFLDCNDRLSVQVHPNDEQARQMGRGQNGKTEAWVILEAKPGSVVYAGLKPGVDRQALERHLDVGTVEDCLHSFPARVGDCVFIPAGTVHALGEGILLEETQQSSDVTFRLFDWGRVGPDGKPRTLHREEALACIDFARGPVNPVVPRVVAAKTGRTEELLRCDYFVLRRRTLGEPADLDGDGEGPQQAGGRFRILMPLAGEVDVRGERYQKRLRVGNTLLVPASAKGLRLLPAGEATLLDIRPA